MDTGELYEEFGTARIERIVSAVQSRSIYTLERYEDPDPEGLTFDFSAMEPTARNTVLAVMAAELVFRLIPDFAVGPEHTLDVPADVADFLAATFSGYGRYFAHPVDVPTAEAPDNSEAQTVGKEEAGTADTARRFTHVRADRAWDAAMMVIARERPTETPART